ncbi:hypothetical protein BDF19DRAFT_453615 [Syncephalis fuscata]|nr:hypothetical protein BDF19DRAFT_453615 [Syncephalis fuscata]
MGASQSSSFADNSSAREDNKKKTADTYTMKTCYYELLCVERTATDNELKKAYRKQALIWHPDKNYDNIDEATRVFALIQHAYEVLSDPHERAWYDGHRDEILREDGDYGGDVGGQSYSTVSGHTPESLMRYFSPDCYTGFDDSSKSFYTIYRELFAQLATEEVEAHNPDIEDDDTTATRLDWLSSCSFGNNTTAYIDDNRPERSIKVFYNEWSNFSTRKSFRWLDKWRLSDAPNRFVKRHMEKENKKNREVGRRAYNDAVRNLVAFVRRRDPRYKQFLQEQEVLRKEREAAQKARLAAEKAERLQRLENYEAPAWAKSEEHDAVLDELDDVWEEEEEQWECQACNKRFKNERQFKNHESTKKHREMVEILRKELLAEDGVEEEDDDSDSEDNEVSIGSDAATTDSETEEIEGEAKAQGNMTQASDKATSDEEEGQGREEQEEIATFSVRSKKAQKKAAAKRRAGRNVILTEADLPIDGALNPDELADLLAKSTLSSTAKSSDDKSTHQPKEGSADEDSDTAEWTTSSGQRARDRKSGRGRRRAKPSRPVELITAETTSPLESDGENSQTTTRDKKKAGRKMAGAAAAINSNSTDQVSLILVIAIQVID